MFQGPNQLLAKLKLNRLLDLRDDSGSGPKILLRIQTKTADYTCLATDSGTIFTTYGDTGAIVFTLPVAKIKGWFSIFVQSTDQSITVTNGTGDELITYNDVQADGVAFSTSSHKAGGCFLVFCDGNAYHAIAVSSHTLTVNT